MNAKEDKYKNGRVVTFVNECGRKFDEFIESQIGFKSFKTDKKKRKDKKFNKFFKAYDKQKMHFEKCKQKGKGKKARDCFNDEGAAAVAEVISACQEIITT
jgi:hypothetical protein